MPIYVYTCSACGKPHEALQKMSDPVLVDCPQCGKPALVKQVTAAGFQLKGTGWYVTDFRNNGSAGSGSSASDAGSSSGGAASEAASSATAS